MTVPFIEYLSNWLNSEDFLSFPAVQISSDALSTFRWLKPKFVIMTLNY